jgi:hypothetical protein
MSWRVCENPAIRDTFPLVRRSLFILLLTVAATAGANPYLEEGRRLFVKLEVQEAITRLEIAQRVTTNSLEEKQEILELLGRAHLSLNQISESEAAFSELLELAPSTELDRRLPPKVRALFQKVKARLFAPGQVEMKQVASPSEELWFKPLDPWNRIHSVRLTQGGTSHPLNWFPSEQLWKTAASGEGSWTVEAVDSQGGVLARSEFSPPIVPRQLAQPRAESPAFLNEEAAPPPEVQTRSDWRSTARLVAFCTAAVAVGAGTYFQISSLQAGSAVQGQMWADSARDLHSTATHQAYWATALFITGGAAAATGLVLFVW